MVVFTKESVGFQSFELSFSNCAKKKNENEKIDYFTFLYCSPIVTTLFLQDRVKRHFPDSKGALNQCRSLVRMVGFHQMTEIQR